MRKYYEYDINKDRRRALIITFCVLIVLAVATYFLLDIYVFVEEENQNIVEIPIEPGWLNDVYWIPVNAPLKNDIDNRSPEEYYNVIAQFQVESSDRYAKKDDNTFCNIFTWDVASAMNVRIPHYFDDKLMPADEEAYVYTGSANVRACFLEIRGKEYGWKVVDAKTAQLRANEGYPTIGVWKNNNAAVDDNGVSAHYPSGHMMVVRPSPTGISYRRIKGPYIAQAGEENTMLANVSDVMSIVKKSQVIYYTHD
jgi:hypothetical protein